ncbi:Kef-type K+ transport system membrane component KefB [Granulicella aggregans]|uniref:Kef-type K+ transport system membrane component KefB n=1 Tax=Granulicella aggregans TaxID=474949 RepID=A0A7W8E4S2_9BACT|nr:Kef-type K+ transport system membrane component KefB [Granulicella aggregans]
MRGRWRRLPRAVRRTEACRSGVWPAALVAHSLRIRFAPAGIGGLPFTLFLGISMSITAFPVLARILQERGMQSTSLGATALQGEGYGEE